MWDTVILFLFGFSAIFVTLYNFIISNTLINMKNAPKTLLLLGLVTPLLEEALFRSVLKQYLDGFFCMEYANYINALLFGLVHASNYIISKNILITLFQIISTTYLGYYVVQFENFLYAFLTHATYNICIVFFGYVTYILYCRKMNISYLDSDIKFNNFCDDLVPISIVYPTKSQDDFYVNKITKHTQPARNFCNRYSINKEMLERIDKLYEIDNKRGYVNYDIFK